MPPAPTSPPPYRRQQAIATLFECAWIATLHDPHERHHWIMNTSMALAMLTGTAAEISRAANAALILHPVPVDETATPTNQNQEMTNVK